MSVLKPSKTLLPSIKIPKFVKRISKLSYILPSKITVSIADKIFSTPVKFSTPEREQTMWESAQKKRIKVQSINKEIEVLTYGYSPEKVLLIHGWSGRSTQLYMIADKLLENGYMVVSFDAPAHGNSEGKTVYMQDFFEVIEQINTQFGPFESAIGHSLGGMVLLNTEKKLALKSLITIGAGDTLSEIITRFVHNMGIKPSISLKLKKFYDHKADVDVDTLSSYRKAKEITTPTLVVHDSQDGDVAVHCAVNIHKNLPKGSLLITEGLGHTKILRDKKTINHVVDFIKQNQ